MMQIERMESQSTEPPPPEEGDELERAIVVTGVRVKETSDDGGGGAPVEIVFAYSPPPDFIALFEQHGGGEQPAVIQYALIDGKIVVRLPGYDFPVKIAAPSWNEMSDSQKGAFLKAMSEHLESPKFKQALDHFQSEGVSEVEIYYDTKAHRLDGDLRAFPTDATGYIEYAVEPVAPGQSVDDTDIRAGTKVVITINERLVTGGGEFAKALMHEFRHPLVPGADGNDEAQLRHDEREMYDDIFRGDNERSIEDYIEGQTVAGSVHADTVVGSGASDTLAGLSGNDVLDGAAGDDLVMGGAGMDTLSGGLGTNVVAGGLDADLYVPAAGVTLENVRELGGVDRIDLSRVSIDNALFTREGDTLVIRISATFEEIVVDNQWLAESKVEQFTFAEGTYAASYIESLAQSPGGGTGVCYDNGQPVICGPFGLPVVLDLDGDGIELVEVDRSRARFDINGDGESERIGWVGKDDGILALDRNGNGRIDDFGEISFLKDFLGAGSDLEGLFAYDSDGDGFLTGADDRFDEFRIWRDSNGNGRSEKGELFTLDDLGIVGIGLERANLDPLDTNLEANQILATSVFQTADGRDHLVGDVALFAKLDSCGCGNRGFQAEFVPVQDWF